MLHFVWLAILVTLGTQLANWSAGGKALTGFLLTPSLTQEPHLFTKLKSVSCYYAVFPARGFSHYWSLVAPCSRGHNVRYQGQSPHDLVSERSTLDLP